MAEKVKNRSVKYVVLLLVVAMVLPFLITLAWFTSTDSASGNLGFGEGINVKIDGNETQTFKLFESAGKLLPGSKITPKPVKLNVSASSTPFVLRARVKVDSTGGTLPQELLDSFTNGIGIVENSWLEHDGWFYYIGYGATGNYVMETVAESATAGTGTEINGAFYTQHDTARTKPTSNEESYVLTSIYADNEMTVNFTNSQQPFRIDTNINSDDIAGKEISVKLEVQAVQDFIVLENVNVLPTIANAKQVFPQPPYTRINKDGTLNHAGDHILFGEYPQTIKASGVTFDESKGTDSRGYYLGSDGFYYAKVTAKPHTTVINKKKTYSNGTDIMRDTPHYFKVEPIKWRILNPTATDGKYIILSDIILEAMRYDDDKNNYENSEVRNWLNSTFYDKAFNEAMKGIVLTTEVDNSASTTESDPNPNASDVKTNDKVYLLSYKDLINPKYGFNEKTTRDPSREKQTSDYGIATGAYIAEYEGNWNGYWWSRSPSDDDGFVCFVDFYGSVGSGSVFGTLLGAASALTIQIS